MAIDTDKLQEMIGKVLADIGATFPCTARADW